jgi:hypothetical protein
VEEGLPVVVAEDIGRIERLVVGGRSSLVAVVGRTLLSGDGEAMRPHLLELGSPDIKNRRREVGKGRSMSRSD